jgi:hypothetical protein
VEGGEDEAQRHGAERDGPFVEGAKEPSPALAPAAPRPLQVPELDWKQNFELVDGRERGTVRESARGQTSKGEGKERERAADTRMVSMAHHLGALNPLLLCQLRGANVRARGTRPRPAGKWGVFVGLFTSARACAY